MLYPFESSTREVKPLDGLWKLFFDPEHTGLEKDFINTPPLNCEEIAVPGSINEQILERWKYNNMDWVWYFRSFFIPDFWKTKRIFLRFDAVSYSAKVYLNGRFLGTHEGGYTPFEFEIGNTCNLGALNHLAVLVDNPLSLVTIPQGKVNPSVGGVANWRPGNYPDVHYDFFPYMGIQRPVRIYATGASRLEKLFLTTEELFQNSAVCKVQIKTSGSAQKGELCIPALNLNVSFEIKNEQAEFSFKAEKVVFWSHETPMLYDIEIRIFNQNGFSDLYRMPYGFRKIEIKGYDFLLNGKKIFFRGFGKHEDTAVAGKGLNLPYLVKDAKLMKWLGANSYRTSHYPYSEEAMFQADREGFLIIDETAANTLSMLGVQNPTDRKIMAENHIKAIRELIERDYNHPCVMSWSLGNECETKNAADALYFQEMITYAKTLDHSRPMTFVIFGLADDEEAAHCFDWICFNTYPSWYGDCGRFEEIETILS